MAATPSGPTEHTLLNEIQRAFLQNVGETGIKELKKSFVLVNDIKAYLYLDALNPNSDKGLRM